MKNRSNQQGIALLVLVTLLATAATTAAVKALSNSNPVARDKITAAALAQAKEALIGYAITYAENHPSTPSSVQGYLPCPDISGADIGGEGAAAGVCGTQDVSVIGRLPWKTLDLPPLRGGDNECLWYAVSGTYKNSPKTGLMNWDTNGQLQVYASDGTLLTPADNQAVAVIFAPGSATTGQNRTGTTAPVCGGNYTTSNYLDTVGTINNATVSATAGATSQFRLGDITSPSGDRMIFITRQDIWNAMKKREAVLLDKLDNMTRLTAECIRDYGNKNTLSDNHSLPWPTRLTLSDYGNTASYYDRINLYAGRVPYQVDISRLRTGNTISSDYLLTSSGVNCPVPADWAAIYPWWYNWKEHLFYAISQRFKPSNTGTNSVCDSDHHCLHVNSSGNYAAVVIFAGKNLSGAIRSDKSIISNYLEGRNNSNMTGFANGNENYQIDATSSTFNDIVYCIRDDLSLPVVKGTAAAGCP